MLDIRRPQGRARRRGRPRAGDRRPAPGDPPRRDLCAGRRVGLRQEHDRAGADAPAARERARHRRPHRPRRAATCWRCPSRRCVPCAAARIGMIFQEPATSLNPVMRVGEQIVEAIETHTALRGAPARAKAIDWLRRVGIPEPERRIDEYPFRMSGGQKQRVMIAMTLAAEPDFLIADEPTTALGRHDPGADPRPAASDLQREQGMGLLLITHDLARGLRHGAARGADVCRADHRGAPVPTSSSRAQAPVCAAAAARAARREPARRAAGGDRRHRAAADWQSFAGCRFAPRCDRVMARCADTLPELMPLGPARSVRCLLYDRRAGARRTRPAELVPFDRPQASAMAAGRGRAGRARCCSRCKTCSVRFPIRKGLLQRTAGHFDAVDGVSFEHRPGQTLALVGESGCGKTTTGKAIVQLLRGQAVIEGQALLGGSDLFDAAGRRVARGAARRSRSSSRTRSRRSTRACASSTSSKKACSRCARAGRRRAARAPRKADRPGRPAPRRAGALSARILAAASASASRSRARWPCSRS